MASDSGTLTIVRAKSAKPGKHFDGGGLFLHVFPNGSRYWRLKYRFAGKEKLLVKLEVDSLTERITHRFNSSRSAARRLIKLDYEASGRLEQHELDLALVNGELKLGALALSFARENKTQLRRDMDAAAFAVEDIRRSNRGLPLVVLAYRPDTDDDDLKRATALFRNWKAQVIPQNRIDHWSKTVVDDLPHGVLQE